LRVWNVPMLTLVNWIISTTLVIAFSFRFGVDFPFHFLCIEKYKLNTKKSFIKCNVCARLYHDIEFTLALCILIHFLLIVQCFIISRIIYWPFHSLLGMIIIVEKAQILCIKTVLCWVNFKIISNCCWRYILTQSIVCFFNKQKIASFLCCCCCCLIWTSSWHILKIYPEFHIIFALLRKLYCFKQWNIKFILIASILISVVHDDFYALIIIFMESL
jgi:hypothetical protein